MATSYLSPGVYVEEVDRGTKPLEMVGTSTAAFLGESSVGPVQEPVYITNWSQFVKNFGDFISDSVTVEDLGEKNSLAIKLMKDAGWN